MKNTCVSVPIILATTLMGIFAIIYFFEDLPMELRVEAWVQAHPGRRAFYQNGPLHTFLSNLGCDQQPIDAVLLYRQFKCRE